VTEGLGSDLGVTILGLIGGDEVFSALERSGGTEEKGGAAAWAGEAEGGRAEGEAETREDEGAEGRVEGEAEGRVGEDAERRGRAAVDLTAADGSELVGAWVDEARGVDVAAARGADVVGTGNGREAVFEKLGAGRGGLTKGAAGVVCLTELPPPIIGTLVCTGLTFGGAKRLKAGPLD
jgi:hypothetical protein